MTKILVIEKEEVFRENLLEILEYLGYESIGAKDATRCVNLVVEHQPDIIICDLLLSQIEDYTILTAIRQTPEISGTPFIILSSQTQKSAIQQGLDLGANDYLVKPLTIAQLQSSICNQIEKLKMSYRSYTFNLSMKPCMT